MNCISKELSYRDTGFFSDILNAYVDNDERLRSFIKYPVSFDGLKAAIEQRRKNPVDRKLLAGELLKQYQGLEITGKVLENIQLLVHENTFTVCTAHQPAIFTGNLFFIYKILHAIKLAEELKKRFPENNFVPVYFMGSEDADLDELGNIFMNGEKIAWDTKQRGAIGRMNTKDLGKIIARIEGELLVLPFGNELVQLLKSCYLDSPDIQTATLKLVHALFASYGLLVLIPDNPGFKRKLLPVFEDELLNQHSSAIVSETVESIPASFKVQAHPRDINLFYLKDDIRLRIERQGEKWIVVDTDISFDRESIRKELQEHPERFSPNVILRGIMQETLLPDIAFIGGGGELAYWMELKELFEYYKVFYPMLIVRNSFLVIEEKWKNRLDKLGISVGQVFQPEQSLLNLIVRRESQKQLSLEKEIGEASLYYQQLKALAGNIDVTLEKHVDALRAKAIKPVEALEKKMLRAEKRKFEEQSRQLAAVKKALFPNNGLQERVDNFMPYYAKWGRAFIQLIYDNSLTMEQRFVVLETDS